MPGYAWFLNTLGKADVDAEAEREDTTALRFAREAGKQRHAPELSEHPALLFSLNVFARESTPAPPHGRCTESRDPYP